MLLDLHGNQNIPPVITLTVMFGVRSFIFGTAYHKSSSSIVLSSLVTVRNVAQLLWPGSY
jgi:predicted neutral ceramidase superfamily lipid hydrolase